MQQSLDVSQEQFKALLDRSSQIVLDLFENLQERKGYHDFPQSEVEAWFDEALPAKGMPFDALLDEVKTKVLDTATGNLGPNMYAYVMAGGTQVSIVAEKLAATINQNLGKWHLGHASNEIEKRLAQWIGQALAYADHAAGVMVSGGSAANLAGLTVARNIFFARLQIRKKGLFGMKPFTVYASKEVHGCVDKSLELLGIGSDQLRKIACNADFTINIAALKAQIEQDKAQGYLPFCIVGTAGSVNTGAVDDMNALADIAQAEKMWFHIDGAYGGLVGMLETKKHLYQGIERADSVALDFHKWLYQPFEAGCLLVKDWATLKNAYFKKADYLDSSSAEGSKRVDFNEHYFQLSRNSKALKAWMSIKAYGMDAIKAMIQKDIDLAEFLADEVEKAADFRLKARSDMAIACFQYTGGETDEELIIALNKALIPALEKDGRVFIMSTKLNGEFVIRACLINHRKTEATTLHLLEVIRKVGQGILSNIKDKYTTNA